MISFKGTHFPKDVILYAVFFYVRYGVSYRDLEEKLIIILFYETGKEEGIISKIT
jgi:transposase-like protein